MLREKFTTLAPPSPYVYLQMVRTNQLAEHIRKGQKVAQPSKRYETRIRSWVTNNYYAGWKRTAWIQEYKNQLRKSIVLTLNTDIPVSISFFNHFLDQLPGIPPVHHGLDITKKLEREAKQGRINNILCDIKDGDHKLEYETDPQNKEEVYSYRANLQSNPGFNNTMESILRTFIRGNNINFPPYIAYDSIGISYRPMKGDKARYVNLEIKFYLTHPDATREDITGIFHSPKQKNLDAEYFRYQLTLNLHLTEVFPEHYRASNTMNDLSFAINNRLNGFIRCFLNREYLAFNSLDDFDYSLGSYLLYQNLFIDPSYFADYKPFPLKANKEPPKKEENLQSSLSAEDFPALIGSKERMHSDGDLLTISNMSLESKNDQKESEKDKIIEGSIPPQPNRSRSKSSPSMLEFFPAKQKKNSTTITEIDDKVKKRSVLPKSDSGLRGSMALFPDSPTHKDSNIGLNKSDDQKASDLDRQINEKIKVKNSLLEQIKEIKARGGNEPTDLQGRVVEVDVQIQELQNKKVIVSSQTDTAFTFG